MISPSAAKYFWDMDPSTLDQQKHSRLIISRLLNYGRLNDWRWLLHTYGKSRLSTALYTDTRLGIREPARRLAGLIFS
jgi:hypothetical protein